MSEDLSPEEYRAQLLQRWKIDEPDLAANRAGVLSEHQKDRLRSGGTVNLVLGIVLGAGVIALVLAVGTKPLKPVQYVLSTLAFVVCLFLGSFEFRRRRAAASAGVVECLTGPINVRMQGRAGWYLWVGGTSFKLPTQGWHLANGLAHHVYVAPKAKAIVGIEPAS